MLALRTWLLGPDSSSEGWCSHHRCPPRTHGCLDLAAGAVGSLSEALVGVVGAYHHVGAGGVEGLPDGAHLGLVAVARAEEGVVRCGRCPAAVGGKILRAS